MSTKRIARFLPAAKMLLQFMVGISKSAEVDDPPDSSGRNSLSKIRCRDAILLFEIPVGTHRMHQIIRCLDADKSCRERLQIQHITGNDFRGW